MLRINVRAWLFGVMGSRLVPVARWVAGGKLVEEEWDDSNGCGQQSFSRGPFRADCGILNSGDCITQLSLGGVVLHSDIWW